MSTHRRRLTIGVVALVLGLVAASCTSSSDPGYSSGGENSAISGTPIDGGGLTVGEAIAYSGAQVVAVRGFLIADDNEARLCELVMESFPPQCGEPSVRITNPEAFPSETVQSAQGIRWTDQPVTVFGHIVDGELTIATNVNG